MNKDTLIQRCKDLEFHLNLQGGNHKVTLFSGLKPDGYFLPMIHIGTSLTIPNEVKMSWFVEIFVDNVCAFRHQYYPRENENMSIIEGMVMTRLDREIFMYGVMSAIQNNKSLKSLES